MLLAVCILRLASLNRVRSKEAIKSRQQKAKNTFQNNPFFHKKTLIHRIYMFMARNMCIFVISILKAVGYWHFAICFL
jgi:hypothetical protein